MKLAGYVKNCRKLTGFWGSYPPSYPVEVGLIGARDEHRRLRRIKTFENIPEIKPPRIVRTKVDVDEAFCDESNTSVETSVGVGANFAGHGASTAVTVSFENESGLLLAYSGATYRQVEDVDLLKRQILALANDNIWQLDWIAVIETIEAKHVAVLTAGGKQSKITFNVKANAAAFSTWQLARADLTTVVSPQNFSGLQHFAGSVTPLYRTLALKKNWRGKITAELSGGSPVDDDDFIDLPWFGAGEFGADDDV